MSVTLRRFGVRWLFGLAVLAGVAASARAQYRTPYYGPRPPGWGRSFGTLPIGGPPVNPNPFIAPGLTLQQAAHNTAVMGGALRSIPPYFLGHNPYTPPVISTGPVVQPAYPAYPGGTPYGATLGTDPYGYSSGYSLSTTPGAAAAAYGNPWGGGFGSMYTPEQGYLYGAAALTSAQADYYAKIMQAKLTREEVRRSAIETARARAKWEREYEENRPGLQDYREKQRELELRIARGEASDGRIVSGDALNTLLSAIKAPGRELNSGPPIPLQEDLLAHLTVRGPRSPGNIGLLRDGGKLRWPTVLQDERFKDSADKLAGKLEEAVKALKSREALQPAQLRDIDNRFKALDNQVVAAAEDLPPQQYIEARQYLNRLRGAVQALGDGEAVKYFDNTWTARGGNVAELVKYMSSSGLRFAPAAPGSESAYLALYQALRAFEAGLQTASR